MDTPTERFDIILDSPASDRPEKPATGRPYLGVHYSCCRIYARIYRNAQGTAYAGNCPRCGKGLTIGIGPGGSDRRFFTTS